MKEISTWEDIRNSYQQKFLNNFVFIDLIICKRSYSFSHAFGCDGVATTLHLVYIFADQRLIVAEVDCHFLSTIGHIGGSTAHVWSIGCTVGVLAAGRLSLSANEEATEKQGYEG